MMSQPTLASRSGLITLILIWLLSCTTATADPASPRHHVWDKTPIKIVLPVGVEKRIEFPAPVSELKIPAPIADPVSRVQLTPDGRLYWLATLPWEEQRIIAQTADGYVYLLDVQASGEYGEPNPLIIEHPAPGDPGRYAPENIAPGKGYDYVDLTRFAAQHMHGPARLIKPLPGVTRLPVKQERIDHLFRGDRLRAVPVAQWRSPRPALYVTAVRVTNKTRYPVELSPRYLRGQEIGIWRFAAPHHPGVDPRGRLGDTSFWYLITEVPFMQALSALEGVRSTQVARPEADAGAGGVRPQGRTGEPDDELMDGVPCCK